MEKGNREIERNVRKCVKKRCKKILLYGSMFLVMNILFAACTGEVKETVLPNASPTVTVTVTQQPESTQAATTIKPTKEPKLTPSPTEEPRQHITPTLAATVTPSLVPTEIPTAAPTVTSTPVLQPTAIPHLTEIPHLTATPTLQPTATPTMMVTPTPAKDPLTLVYGGWQQVTDLSGHYTVVFPDIYDKVSLKKESDFFKYVYTASAMSDIKWELYFNMEETVEMRQKKIIEQYPEMRVKSQADGFAYYAETDTVFVTGEVYAWNYETVGIHGVMHIENSYPKEKKEEYQKEMYHWYVCMLKEE